MRRARTAGGRRNVGITTIRRLEGAGIRTVADLAVHLIMRVVINHQSASESVVAEGASSGEEPRPLVPPGGRRELVAALLLVLLGFLTYNANLRLVSAGDNYPARYLPFGILKHGTLALDPIADVVAQGHAHPYWCVKRGGHTYSRYPITVPVLVTPLYVPAVAYLHWQGWTEQRLENTARVMEKLTSALIASVSVGLMYLLLVRRTSCRWPLLLTLAYGFGANTWMISSQALWQHGLAELLIVLALFLVLGPCTAPRALAVGTCLALIAAVRPPDAILAAALGLFGLRWARGNVRFLVLGATIPLVLVLAYNCRVAHHPAGGYSVGINGNPFKYSLALGFAGLLFSPTRGLFVFSPFLLFLPFGLRHTLRGPRVRALALLALGAVVAQVALYAKLDWRAGCAWGPRWLTDMLPLLVWMLAAGLGHLRRIGLAVFVLTVCLSIGAQVVGAFWYTGASDAVIMERSGDPNSQPVVWDPRNTPFVAELHHDLAPREMLLEAKGSVDRIRADGCAVEQIIPGVDLEIEGWALTDRRTPTVVQVMLVPTGHTPWHSKRKYPAVGTATFFERPDVTRAMQGLGPAGWRVVVKTDGLDPGPHLVEVRAQGNKGGECRHVAQRPILVLPVGLGSLSRVARERLRGRQHADGYWLTAYTASTRFDQPRPEMNVFVTAMISEALGTVAKAAGFEENMERARRHLRRQIEPGGLVRYHGRPDSPTIPSLGCVITPDADDTALAWRIAGPKGDARLAGALDVLKSYRDPGGLYRTWLAPRAEYISIDPGEDPNPPDVGIQMHVLMLLARVDPTAARSLHQALQTAIGEDRTWVYYKRAPLVPLWRAADLHNLGYPVCVPPHRLQTAAPGQEIWVTACRQLARYTARGARRPAPAETSALLESLGKNNFAAIRRNPPLLYHNDLTARCSRYYWSEDFGYALWLRLYLELAASSP
jgi:hypothetical protein